MCAQVAAVVCADACSSLTLSKPVYRMIFSDATRFSSGLSFNSAGDKMTLITDYPLVKSMHDFK